MSNESRTAHDLEFEAAQLLRRVGEHHAIALDRQQQLLLLEGTCQAMHRLLTSAASEVTLRQALTAVAKALDVDRAYLYTNLGDVGKTTPPALPPLLVWAAGGIEGETSPNAPTISPQWLESLRHGEIVTRTPTEAFSPRPGEAAKGESGSVLMLPIVVEGSLWGALCFEMCYEARQWSAWEIAALRRVAEGIGGAVQRQEAEAALQRRSRNLALIHRASQAFSSTLDLDHVLVTVLEEVRRLLGVAATSIWLMDFESGELVCRHATGPQSTLVRGWRLAPGEGVAGYVVRSGKSLIIDDVQTDTRYFNGVEKKTGIVVRSLLTAPLLVNQEAIGVLQVVDTQPHRFSTAELELLEPLAASAAIAIENAFLYGETEVLRAFNENIVQSMEEGILLEDAGGRITFVNARMQALVDYAPEGLIGQHWSVLADPAELTEMARRGPHPPGRYEAVLRTRAGRVVPVLVSARPISGELPWERESSPFAGTLVVFTDITERREAERMLRQRYEDLLTLNEIAVTLGRSPDLAHALTETLERVLEVTEASGGWIHLRERKGNRLTLIAHRGCPPALVEGLQTVQMGVGVVGEVAQAGQPRFQVTMDDVHAPIILPVGTRPESNGVLGLLGDAAHPLSSQKVQLLTAIAHHIGMAVENARLTEEASEIEILREVDRLRSELIANVSHELRTPLGLIKMFCTSLLMDDVSFDRETQMEFLRGIDEQTDRLEVIVDNLLDLSRAESGRLHLDLQAVDVGTLARKVMAEVEREVTSTVGRPQGKPSASYRFVYDFPEQPLIGRVDARRIEQVLRNLLSNAVKYSPDGGTITVQGRGDRWQLLIRVSDEGIGIPPHEQEHVFERFYRVENEVTRRTRGAGLGLSVCRSIVEAHGGHIWVESTPGKGSTFYFTLPVGDSEERG